ncbi:MerR family transcriptional regulator [Kibdelosporangium philippinense]|uniref:MerR family transcriptional regulator n=1 Tax=Kibdelosporangium philippinense TaxID=211113 RepID=A0ABS8Z8A6_9PSEU|nr:MerR family transcriptional regulator [Kibdelosporangium philippinense]MCE7004125.1 MerR family transcriptional regulator [Kibdelosporangium philippinense]
MTELFSIGQLARTTGLPVRTVRFWSDLGLVPPAGRTSGNYRMYDAEAAARLDLVRTLRELGIDLDTVERVLRDQVTLADVAKAHVRALDTEIRTLRLRRAVLNSVASRGSTTEEMKLMHELAKLSAQERQRIIDTFVDEAFAGVDNRPEGTRIADGMRTMPTELPDDPTPEQVDAWIELAELVADPSFKQRVREMAVAGASDQQPPAHGDPQKVFEHAAPALAAGIDPTSAEGQDILHRIIPADMSTTERRELADTLATFSDRRVERYWTLLGKINGWSERPASVPVFEWFIDALRT